MTDTGELRYFGQMTAAVTHDIKNCLAIMNENAGLLGDLLAMGQQRPPVDIPRLEGIVGRIEKQIFRADAIVRQMNRFSHSVDHDLKHIELFEAVSLAATMGVRISANRNITIQPLAPETKVYVSAPFFSLLQQIWLVLDAAMQEMAPDSLLTVAAATKEDRPCLNFSSQEPIGPACETAMASPAGRYLAERLSARGSIDQQGRQVTLVFPKPGAVR